MSFERFQDAERTVEVFIKGPLLKFVSKAAAIDDPELAVLLDNLVLIKVNVFSIDDKDTEQVLSIINNITERIDRNKWELMVRAKEPDEHVEVYTLFGDDDNLTGLVVMAVEDRDEAVFVNIVGNIDPTQLGKLSNKFNIPELDSLEINTRSYQ